MEAVFCEMAARHIDLDLSLLDFFEGKYQKLRVCDDETKNCDESCPCYVFTKKKKGV